MFASAAKNKVTPLYHDMGGEFAERTGKKAKRSDRENQGESRKGSIFELNENMRFEQSSYKMREDLTEVKSTNGIAFLQGRAIWRSKKLIWDCICAKISIVVYAQKEG